MPRLKKRGVPGPRRKYYYLKKPKASDCPKYLKEENKEGIQNFVKIDNCRTNDSPVCQVETADVLTIKTEAPDLTVQKEENEEGIQNFVKIDNCRTNDSPVCQVETADVLTIKTEVPDLTVQTISIPTSDQSVQTFESENDHTYAKSILDYCCEDIPKEIYKVEHCQEMEREGDEQFRNIEDDEVIVESLSFKDFFSDLKENLKGKYSIYETDCELILIQFYNSCVDSLKVKFTVKFNKDFKCSVYVHRKEIPRSHSLWTDVPQVLHDVESVLKLLEKLESYTVCCGNPELEYHDLVPVGSGLTNSTWSGVEIVAYREGDFGAVTAKGKPYHSTIRSASCELLTETKEIYVFGVNSVKKEKCKNCKRYGYALTKRQQRIENRKVNRKKFCKSHLKHKDMTIEELCFKIEEQEREISDLTHTVWKLNRQFDNYRSKDCVKVNEHANTEF